MMRIAVSHSILGGDLDFVSWQSFSHGDSQTPSYSIPIGNFKLVRLQAKHLSVIHHSRDGAMAISPGLI